MIAVKAATICFAQEAKFWSQGRVFSVLRDCMQERMITT